MLQRYQVFFINNVASNREALVGTILCHLKMAVVKLIVTPAICLTSLQQSKLVPRGVVGMSYTLSLFRKRFAQGGDIKRVDNDYDDKKESSLPLILHQLCCFRRRRWLYRYPETTCMPR